MSNLKYQKWYEVKKEKEADILYEKLTKIINNKNILNQELESPSDNAALYAAEALAKKLKVNVNSNAGRDFINSAKKNYSLGQDSKTFTQKIATNILNAYIKYIKDSNSQIGRAHV